MAVLRETIECSRICKRLRRLPLHVAQTINASAEDGNLYSDCVMKMITDTRSNKVKELGAYHNEWNSGNTAEMVWW